MVRLPNANVGRKTDRSIVRLRRSGFPQRYAWRIENRKQRDCLGLRVSYFWVQGRPSSIFYFTQWIKKQISNARNLTRNWLNVNIWCSDDQFSCPLQNDTYRFLTLVSSKARAMWLFLESPNCLLPERKAGSDSATHGPWEIPRTGDEIMAICTRATLLSGVYLLYSLPDFEQCRIL